MRRIRYCCAISLDGYIAGTGDEFDEVAVMPMILGGGIPLVAEPSDRIPLTLTERRTYEKTGTVMLVYAVQSSRRRQGRQR